MSVTLAAVLAAGLIQTSPQPAGPEAALSAYRAAIESLDGAAAAQAFWPDGRVFEQGSDEGVFATYLSHHLGPELAAFESFDFQDETVTSEVEGDIAWAVERYRYVIRFRDASRAPVERQGVSTSVLQRRDGAWRILMHHGSSRAPRTPPAA